MHSSRLRGKILASTILAGITITAQSALAQDTTSAPPASSGAAAPATAANIAQGGTPADEIVVTGSRIARPDLAAASPVATISGAALQLHNAVTVESILQQNPQFIAADNSASNNPGSGVATIDLRGLGPKRTLVLIDGKRAPEFSTEGEVDVNAIPTALIKRIDILTGGASAVYGSDAIAGVVNFVLDDRFVGLRADGSSQVTTYGDGAEYSASLTGGAKIGDRGNIVVSGSYTKRNTVKFGDRKDTSPTLDSTDLKGDPNGGGSSNTIPTAFDTGDGRLQVTPDGSLTSNVALYGFNPVNYAQIPLTRYTGTALGRYEITDGIELYGRASYEYTHAETNLASTATAGFFFNIDPTNPFLTDAERAAFFNADATINDGSGVDNDPTARAGTSEIGIRRRIVETGGRTEIHNSNSYQGVAGIKGDIGATGLNFDVFGQYALVKRHEVLENDLSYSALQNALDVVPGPDGNPICHSTLTDPGNGCVPLNLFTTAAIPANELSYVLRNAEQDTKTTQIVAGGNVGGNIGFLKSPFADGAAAFSVGVEYRREKAATTVSADYASGDLIYYGQGQNISGKYDTKEAYIELKVPLVQDKPFFHSLGLEGGFRYSDYSTAGNVYTYKGGGDWSPIEGVRFRGIYQRAVRAPNIYELYSPDVAGTGSLTTDPCAGPGVTAASQLGQLCIAQGAPASKIGSIPQPVSGQINVFTGGNPLLTAEKSDTYTIGVVINPPQVRAFSLSVDYYNIRIGNAIDTVSPAVTLDDCIAANSTSGVCGGIKRNTLDGSLSGPIQFGVPEVNGNIDVLKTNGIDVDLDYHGGDPEKLHYDLSFSGTYVRSYTKDGAQCAGHFGSACDIEPISKWKHVAAVDLAYGSLNFLTQWRYLGKVREDALTDIQKSTIPAFSYFDETVSVDVMKQFTFRLGVQNMFNKRPPIIGSTVGDDFNAGNTYPNVYDVLGRTVFAGFTAKM